MFVLSHPILAKLYPWLKHSLRAGLVVMMSSTMCLAQVLDVPFGPNLKSAGWKVHVPSKKSAAVFSVEADESLTVTADQAVAFLYSFIPDDGKTSTVLSWEWQVMRDFAGTDLSEPGADDRPIAVHVYFSDQKAGLLKRLGSGLAGMFGVPVSGRALTYVWGGLQPPRSMMPNPFMKEGEGALVVLQASDPSVAQGWRSETVDLAADYRAAFGEEPPPLSVVAVSADTDDTGAVSRAQIRGLSLGVEAQNSGPAIGVR